VANETVLIAHEQAFADPEQLYGDLRRLLPSVQIIEVPGSVISLADAVASYLFNAQLLTLPEGGMALIIPTEAESLPQVRQWLRTLVAGNGPVRRVIPVDVRESMANGGGPACLRLRVVADPRAIDPRFLVDESRLDRIEDVIARWWPEAIAPAELANPALWRDLAVARNALLQALALTE
jgi:succinylarginine dihydrolase